MSSSGGMDIRAPIGGLFTLLGVMLVGYGLLAPESTGAATLSAGTNVNLWWGLALLAFGLFMLLLARRAMKHPVPPHAHPHPEE
jgi:tellurite resistance protein TehA-like permease